MDCFMLDFKKNFNREVDETLFPFSCFNMVCMNLHAMNLQLMEIYFGITNNGPFQRNKKNVINNICTIMATEAGWSPF